MATRSPSPRPRSGASPGSSRSNTRSSGEVSSTWTHVRARKPPPTQSQPSQQRRPVDGLAWLDFQRQFEGAVGAAFHLCRAALPHLRRDAQGAIVNIVSDLIEDPVVPYPDYATAKSALVGFSRQLAAELGPQGVRVNCVAPGLVHPTEGSAATRAAFREALAAVTPLRRLARPEDVAGPVVFLASAQSAFITGQVLFVDGGRVMR